MNKMRVLQAVSDAGLIALVRAETKEQALAMSEALIAGGVTVIELMFTVPQGSEVVLTLKEKYQKNHGLIIGAGTVLEAISARIAILAGADFIVSPSFDLETARLCNLYQVPYMAGCMTIAEMQTALMAGVDLIKLYPCTQFTPDFVRAVQAPLPQINVLPTGAVSVAELADWFAVGSFAVAVDEHLVQLAADGDYTALTAAASQYVAKVRQIKG